MNLIISMADMITVWLKNVFLQASKGSLHRDAASGQHETVKGLLESGQDVDQSDEVLVFFSLCKSNVMPGLSRSLYLQILFEENNNIGRTVWKARKQQSTDQIKGISKELHSGMLFS